MWWYFHQTKAQSPPAWLLLYFPRPAVDGREAFVMQWKWWQAEGMGRSQNYINFQFLLIYNWWFRFPPQYPISVPNMFCFKIYFKFLRINLEKCQCLFYEAGFPCSGCSAATSHGVEIGSRWRWKERKKGENGRTSKWEEKIMSCRGEGRSILWVRWVVWWEMQCKVWGAVSSPASHVCGSRHSPQCLPGLQREEIDHNKKCQRDLINEDEDNIVDCGTSVQIKHMKELPL